MMSQHFKYTLLASSFCVVLTSCSAGGGPGYSKVRSYSTQGCVAGGLLGAVIGATVGSGDNAAGGAALGCAIGAYVGYRVAKRTDRYISAEQAVDAEIARNTRNTAGVRKNNVRLKGQIANYENVINQVKQAKVAESVKKNDLTQIKDHLSETISKASADLNALDEELVTVKKLHAKYKVTAKPKKAKNWSKQIASLKKEKEILNRHVKSLTALNDSI